MAMIPVTEMQASIPYGMAVYKMSALEALIISLAGNITIVFVLLRLIPVCVDFLFKHSPFLAHHIKKYFDRLHAKHSMRFYEFGGIFLTLFISIPGPGSGAWTGSLLAYLFNMPFKLALISVALGLAVQGIIVSFFSGSIIELWQWATQ